MQQELRDAVESILSDRREAERRTGFGSKHAVRHSSFMMELAKIIFPAVLAVGGAWLSMDHRMSQLEAEVRAMTVSLQEMKTMLGIGVYKGAQR